MAVFSSLTVEGKAVSEDELSCFEVIHAIGDQTTIQAAFWRKALAKPVTMHEEEG